MRSLTYTHGTRQSRGSRARTTNDICWEVGNCVFRWDCLSVCTVYILITSAKKEVMFSLRSVCLSVRRITEKVVNGFWRNFLEGHGMAQGPRGLRPAVTYNSIIVFRHCFVCVFFNFLELTTGLTTISPWNVKQVSAALQHVAPILSHCVCILCTHNGYVRDSPTLRL